MPRESLKARKVRIAEVIRVLKTVYPEVYCTLDFVSPFQLLSATILAAQCTDAKVNTVTPTLFGRYPTPFEMAAADPEDLEKIIHPLGFFRQKTKSLIQMSNDLVQKYNGEVPQTMEELTALRGVGRKTANVVLGTCFTGGSVIVDTHCKRLSHRLGFTKQEDPVKIEFATRELLPPEDWTDYGHLMVWHGRAVCWARNPQCEACPVLSLCPFGQKRLAIQDAKGGA